MDDLVAIPADAWVRGGTPEQSRIVPWGVQALDRPDVDTWQGRIQERVVADAVSMLVAELQS